MIDTDKKKYIAELCASVYGSRPRDVVPVQITDAFSGRNVFVENFGSSHSPSSPTNMSFRVKGVVICDSRMALYDSNGLVYTICNIEQRMGFICDSMQKTGNFYCYVAGYECIM